MSLLPAPPTGLTRIPRQIGRDVFQEEQSKCVMRDQSEPQGQVRGGAFTLIELLAVIAVIAILAMLLVPALSAAKARARSTVCKNHLHEMGVALQMYVDDHEDRFPYYLAIPDTALPNAEEARDAASWWGKLLPYYPVKWTDRAYHCPGYRGAIRGWRGRNGDWYDPWGSYAYNARGLRMTWSVTLTFTNRTVRNPASSDDYVGVIKALTTREFYHSSGMLKSVRPGRSLLVTGCFPFKSARPPSPRCDGCDGPYPPTPLMSGACG